MNIYKRELKAGRKPFFFWSLGLFFLVFAGVTKYTGISAGGEEVAALFDRFPKIILAVFGMAELDVTTLPGYYAILAFYSFVCISIYGISLGNLAVNREAADKTYEFVFSKPRSRSDILSKKLLAGFTYLCLFAVFNYVFSIGAVATLKNEASIAKEIRLYAIAVFIVGMLFFSFAAAFAAFSKKTERGSLMGNLIFLLAYLIGMLYDILEKGQFLRIFTPLKYFTANELLEGRLNVFYLGFSLLIIIVFLFATFYRFEKKDLNAVS